MILINVGQVGVKSFDNAVEDTDDDVKWHVEQILESYNWWTSWCKAF
jgi:hypothetical protein